MVNKFWSDTYTRIEGVFLNTFFKTFLGTV